ncbi:MAG: hypothetical protein NTU49_04985 [Gammaproteobacteria bacterium]|nr:hypothetical protein [Gammaproteobacteria bacterium]
MRSFLIALTVIFFCSTPIGAMCTWTYTGCDGEYCYYKGTSSCRLHSCKMVMRDHGAISVSRMGVEVSSGTRDMSLSPENDCTLVYIAS